MKNRLLIFLFIVTSCASVQAKKEFSFTLYTAREYHDFEGLNSLFSSRGYNNIDKPIYPVGINVTWKYNDFVSIDLRTDFLRERVFREQIGGSIDEIEAFGGTTLLGITYLNKRFLRGIIDPGIGIGFGSLQLQTPAPAFHGEPRIYFIRVPLIDSILQSPNLESKLSKRFGLIDLNLSIDVLNLPVNLKGSYWSYIVLKLKLGYTFTFTSSDWRLGPLKVKNGPNVNMNYYYIRFCFGYGGRW
ncbi:MAG: hypothetical protein V3W18_02885 [candidate division Zixibacteria bacterium]